MKALEILFRIKEALDLSHAQIAKIVELNGYEIDEEQLRSLLANRKKRAYETIGYELLGNFLDGLIAYKRGENKKRAADEEEVIIDGNLILKKLRVALELKELEIFIIFELADYPLTKQQIKSLFRRPEHKNFKPCDTATLKAFLHGLEEFYYQGEA